MSFSIYNALGFGKRALWLYEVTYGTTTNRYVNDTTAHSIGGHVWQPSTVVHTDFRETSAIGRAQTTIAFPRSDTFAQQFLQLDRQPTKVVIRKVWAEDPTLEPVIRYTGRVIGVRPTWVTINLLVENRATELRSKGVPAVMQRPCRHAHYHRKDGIGCPAVLSAHQVAGTASALAGNVVTVAEAANRADGVYQAGILEWNGKQQMITGHTGTQLTLIAPVYGFAPAIAGGPQAVLIAPGCKLTRAWCQSEFNALDDHGGFPWMDEGSFDGRVVW